MDKSFEYHFDWDPSKARQNLIKHRVAFKEAVIVFRDANAVSMYDDEHSGEEDRWLTIGMNWSGKVFVVCHTFKAESRNRAYVRIISARKATRKETEVYVRVKRS